MRRGTTLVEVLVALFVLCLLFTLVFAVFPPAKEGLYIAEINANAAFLGESLLEQARSAGFSGVVPSSGSQTFSGLDNGLSFTETVNYTVGVQSVNAGEKEVWAVMTWSEPSGSRQMILETILAND